MFVSAVAGGLMSDEGTGLVTGVRLAFSG